MKVKIIGPNQSELVMGNKTVLFSYSIPVAAKVGNKFYRTNKFHSKTINHHINQWLKGCAEHRSQSWFNQLVE
jgi:Leu/Phe-tRNA-protein transferase